MGSRISGRVPRPSAAAGTGLLLAAGLIASPAFAQGQSPSAGDRHVATAHRSEVLSMDSRQRGIRIDNVRWNHATGTVRATVRWDPHLIARALADRDSRPADHRFSVRLVGIESGPDQPGVQSEARIPIRQITTAPTRIRLDLDRASARLLRTAASVTLSAAQQHDTTGEAERLFDRNFAATVRLTGASPRGVRDCAAVLLTPRADLRGCDLAGAPLARADLHGAMLGDAFEPVANPTELTAAGHAAATRDGAVLAGANLAYADLRRAQAGHSVWWWAQLRQARLTNAHLSLSSWDAVDARGASLRNADLTHSLLRYSDLRGATMIAADLRRTHLYRTALPAADRLRGAVLSGGWWTDRSRCAVPSIGECLPTSAAAALTEFLTPTEATTWTFHSLVLTPSNRYVSKFALKPNPDVGNPDFIYSMPASALVSSFSDYHLSEAAMGVSVLPQASTSPE